MTVDDDRIEWARGPFNEGAKARIDGFSQRHAPSPDVVGLHAHKSWLAGWRDAEAGIHADGLSEKMKVTK